MAGFWAGFGEQLSTNIEQRKKTLDRLIEENLSNARTAKQSYAKRKGAADQVLKSAKAIRDNYGLSEAEALALTEAYGTDLPKLQATIDAQNAELKSNLGVSYTAQDVMSFVNAAQELKLPEGTTLDQGVQRLMGLNAMELAKEKDPKSEGAKTRSFIRAAFAFDPQLQAAEKMQDIKGPGGLSYAQLLEMQEAGFAPEDTFGDVTRAGGVTYDYTSTTAKTTRNDYSRRLSTKIFDADLTNDISFSSYTAAQGEDKASLKANVYSAGDALAKLERNIVLSFRGTDLAMNAFRKGVLDDIYDRVDSAEELRTLTESIRNGSAMSIIEAKQGKLTEEDIDAIISGNTTEEETLADTDNIEETVTTTPETSSSDTAPAATSAVDSEVDRMLSEQQEAPEADVGNITESTTDSDTVAKAATTLYTAMEEEFPDMTVLQGEDGKQVIKDYMEMNNIPVNETVIRLIQLQLPIED